MTDGNDGNVYCQDFSGRNFLVDKDQDFQLVGQFFNQGNDGITYYQNHLKQVYYVDEQGNYHYQGCWKQRDNGAL